LDIYLHEKQSILDADDHRFQVVAAGRRFGKSFFAAYKLYEQASHTHKVRSDGTEIDLLNEVVYYVSPTFKQGKENLWNVMMDIGHQAGIIKGIKQNEGEITLTNGRVVRFKGADDPDSLRGVGLHYCVLDEYAFMKPSVWQYIIRPALGRAEGGALFIGTPDGKNHFYQTWLAASKGLDPMTDKVSDDWAAFQFRSADNPHLTSNEMESMYEGLSEDAQKQELEANFEATGGKVFNYDMFPVVKDGPVGGNYVMAVDLAGFATPEGKNKAKHVLDDHAIAIVRCHEKGYHVERVVHGQWDVRRTALEILSAYRKYRPVRVGVEQGMAKNAVEQFIKEYQEQYSLWFEIEPLRHMNNKKEDRIKWALQGRADQGKLTLQSDKELEAEHKWVGKFLGQAVDFPNPQAHDDLIDSVAYAVDQLGGDGAALAADDFAIFDDWEPLDLEAGY
jgi:phage terminase large subunit-like protein